MAASEVKHAIMLIIAVGIVLYCVLYAFSTNIPVIYPEMPSRDKIIVAYHPPTWFNITSLNMFLRKCKYRNCVITRHISQLEKKDAILFSLTEAQDLPRAPPIKPLERNINQIWIFFWLEPPPHHGYIYRSASWRNTVNWTMSYTSDSDVIYPPGSVNNRTLPLSKDYHEIFQRKTSMAAWAVGHCRTQGQRERYVNKLREEGIAVNIFGKCEGSMIKRDTLKQLLEKEYKFYLAFENSLCKDYITEKFFLYFNYDVVLVVRGSGTYTNLVPSDAVINTADFKSVKQLATYLKTVAANETLYTEYLKSKDKFKSTTVLRHSDAVCSMCEKLNNLDQNRRVYTDLVETIHNGTCFKPDDF